MATTIKAQREKIDIAGIEIFGYLLPDNTYALSGRNVTDAIEVQHKSLVEKFRVKSLKSLPHNDSSLGEIRAVTGEKFIPVSIEDAVEYWYLMSMDGNKRAAALLRALAIESIERRFDRAFGKVVTEQERDLKLAERYRRLQTRRDWTDVIKDIQETQGYYKTKMGNDEFREATVLVNRKLFGVDHFDCDRDNMTPEQQKIITQFEGGLVFYASKRKNRQSAYEIVKEYLELVA